MVKTGTTETGKIGGEQTYRKLMHGLMLAAGGGFTLSAITWFIYEIDALSPYDERYTQIEQEASHITMGVFAYVMLFGLPAVVVFSATGVFEVPPRWRGILDGYIGLFIVFGLAMSYFSSKRS